MIVKTLWIAGAMSFIVLGTLHLLYTFFTNKLSLRNAALDEEMKDSYLNITKETTMSKAWTGFNASHSYGAIYIGVMTIILAIRFTSVLQHPLVMSFNIGTALFYLWLAKKYWFSIPFQGMIVSAACFIAAVVVTLFG